MFSPLPRSEDTPNLGAAAASGTVGTQGVSAEPRHSHRAPSPGHTWGQPSQGPSAVPWEAFLLSAVATELPGVPATAPACSKPSVTSMACERGRAVLPCPHVPAPSWRPPSPGCPWPAGLHQLLSWKRSLCPSRSHLGRTDHPPRAQTELPPDRAAPASVKFTPRPSCGSPHAPAAASPQPLTATKRLPRVWEDGQTVGRAGWVQPRDGKKSPSAPTGHARLQRPGATSSWPALPVPSPAGRTPRPAASRGQHPHG